MTYNVFGGTLNPTLLYKTTFQYKQNENTLKTHYSINTALPKPKPKVLTEPHSRAALISVSIALSQTPTEAASPWIWG